MSTTDTGAAFEAWAITEGLISDSHGIRFVNSMCEVARKAFNAGIAHTEAAKATGTAGERPALTGNDVIEMIVGHLVSIVGGRNLMKGEEIGFSLDDLVFVANAAAARQTAPVVLNDEQKRQAEKCLRDGAIMGSISDETLAAMRLIIHAKTLKHAATYEGVECSRYAIRWENGPMPVGTKLYAITTSQKA